MPNADGEGIEGRVDFLEVRGWGGHGCGGGVGLAGRLGYEDIWMELAEGYEIGRRLIGLKIAKAQSWHSLRFRRRVPSPVLTICYVSWVIRISPFALHDGSVMQVLSTGVRSSQQRVDDLTWTIWQEWFSILIRTSNLWQFNGLSSCLLCNGSFYKSGRPATKIFIQAVVSNGHPVSTYCMVHYACLEAPREPLNIVTLI